MRLLLQRVHEGAVHVDNTCIASIQQGLVVLVGFGQADTAHMPQSPLWKNMIEKLMYLRIFPGNTPDKEHKFHCNIQETEGEILLVSQFTLYANCAQGRRPGFQDAAAPSLAEALFLQFIKDVDAYLPSRVHSGIFGANMDVQLTNWGPVTILLDSEEMFPALHQTLSAEKH